MDPGRPNDAEQIRWLLQHKRRWPLAFIVAAGCSAALFATFTGAARETARARLPGTRAAIAALEPPPVEAGKNAAEVWRKAFAALEEMGSRRDEEPLQYAGAVPSGRRP
jgi:hypothetical protein